MGEKYVILLTILTKFWIHLACYIIATFQQKQHVARIWNSQEQSLWWTVIEHTDFIAHWLNYYFSLLITVIPFVMIIFIQEKWAEVMRVDDSPLFLF
jgi:K+-transporting ATPase A subunit